MLYGPALTELRYDSLNLTWHGDPDLPDGFFVLDFSENTNRFLGTSDPDQLFVWLVAGNRAMLGVDLHTAEPDVDERWEDVVEASISVPEGAQPRWASTSDLTGPLPLPAGDHRVRLSASGRDRELPTLLLEFWPAAARPDAVIRLRSRRGRDFHQEWRVAELGEAARRLRPWSRSGTTLMEAVVSTSYRQIYLVWSDEFWTGWTDVADCHAGQQNGLAGAAEPAGVFVTLARYGCGSLVRMELLDAAPALEECAEDVVEVSTVVPPGAEPRWESWGGESSGDLDLAPGPYRLRISAQGRDEGAEKEFAGYLVDSYLLQFWPAEPRPDEILRVGSNDARYWHDASGGHR